MNEFVKICAKHGLLRRDQVNINTKGSSVSYRCKFCQKESHAKFYENNKVKVRTKCNEYREKDPAKVAAIKARSRLKHYAKNGDKLRAKNRKWRAENRDHDRILSRERKRRCREKLSDGYVKQQIKKIFTFSLEEILPEIIEIKRIQMKIRRISIKKPEKINVQD